MYGLEIRKSVEKEFMKLSKKNPKQLSQIEKKINEIIKNPNRYKNLHKPLQNLKRVHIDSSFVLLFSIKNNVIIIENYGHHDDIY